MMQTLDADTIELHTQVLSDSTATRFVVVEFEGCDCAHPHTFEQHWTRANQIYSLARSARLNTPSQPCLAMRRLIHPWAEKKPIAVSHAHTQAEELIRHCMQTSPITVAALCRYLGYNPKWVRCCTFGPGQKTAPPRMLDDAAQPVANDERAFQQVQDFRYVPVSGLFVDQKHPLLPGDSISYTIWQVYDWCRQ